MPDADPDEAADNLEGHLEHIEREAIVRALEQTRYNKTKAAELLGMSFRQLDATVSRSSAHRVGIARRDMRIPPRFRKRIEEEHRSPRRTDDSTQAGTELFSIVVPVFNTTTTLDQLVQRIAAVFAGLPHLRSRDHLRSTTRPRQETWPTLKRIAHEHGHVRAVQLMRNFGQTPRDVLRHEVWRAGTTSSRSTTTCSTRPKTFRC
jgi:hypothetical protein